MKQRITRQQVMNYLRSRKTFLKRVYGDSDLIELNMRLSILDNCIDELKRKNR